MSNIKKMHKRMYKLILSSCNIEDIEKINQYIEDDKKKILNQDFNIEPDCNDDNIFVKRYVELYRCEVFDKTICKYDDDTYNMDKVAIIISPLYYAEKLVVKKYNELLLAAKQQNQTQPVWDQTLLSGSSPCCNSAPMDIEHTEDNSAREIESVDGMNINNIEERSEDNESKEEGSAEEL